MSNPRRAILTAALLPIAVALAGPGQAQILKDLPAVELQYFIVDPVSSEELGGALVTFSPVETKRGPRLEIRSVIDYAFTEGRQEPFVYHEEVTLACDTLGVTRFDTTVRAIGKERVNVGLRVGDTYQVTTTFEGERTTKAIDIETQRTDLGRFCGGYLAVPLDEGRLVDAWLLLFPAAAKYLERQKYREATIPFDLGGKQVAAIVSRIKRRDKSSHRIWNAANDLQILLRMEDGIPQGELLYVLQTVNGVPATESELLE